MGKKVMQLLVVLALLVVAVFAVSCAKSTDNKGSEPAASDKKAVQIRLVLGSPAGDELTVADEAMAKRFNERAKGEYEIKVYPGGTLAKVPEFLDAVRTGAVEMMDIGWANYGGADNRLNATSVPFVFDNARALGAATPDITKLYDEEVFQKKFNQRGLAMYFAGANDVMGTKPVKTMADWKGMLSGASDPLTAKMVESLGGSAISVTWTDFYTSLEKGVIDVCLISTNAALAVGIVDAVKYSTLYFGIPGVCGYTINTDVWNKMPKNIQDILVEEVEKTAKEKNEHFVKRQEEDIKAFQSLGIEVYQLPAEERAKWKAAVQPLIDESIASMGDFGKKYLEIAEKANKANP